LYNNNTWQIGKVSKNTSTNKIEFTGNVACDRGVTVVKTTYGTDEIYGPSTNNCILTNSKIASGPTNCDYSTSGFKSPDSTSGAVLLNCFRKARPSTGGGGDPSVCSPDSSAAGYCELRDVSSSNAKVSGKWYVQYQSPNKKMGQVCFGGVSYTSSSNLSKLFETGTSN